MKQPLFTFRQYGMPCQNCDHPASYVEVYPRGRKVIHVHTRIACTLSNPDRQIGPEVPR